MAAKLNYRKSDGRYYVDVDGVKVGWVIKVETYDGKAPTWSFYAPVRESLKGQLLACEYPTRREAVREGLAEIRIMHGGGVWNLNLDTIKDELTVIPSAVLRELDERLLDEMYPLAKESN